MARYILIQQQEEEGARMGEDKAEEGMQLLVSSGDSDKDVHMFIHHRSKVRSTTPGSCILPPSAW